MQIVITVFQRTEKYILTNSTYGEPFVAAVKKGQLLAVQFHPEKSGKEGMKISKHFVRGKQHVNKRIIPCLDVKGGQVVKGKCFLDSVFAGDPVDMAKFMKIKAPMNLCCLDITASIEERSTFLDVMERVAKKLSIPFTVGGGIRSLQISAAC